MSLPKLVLIASLLAASHAGAQTQPAASTAGTMVIVPANGEVRHANDQAIVTFAVEEFDKDKAAAAARVNRKMKEGTEIVRRADPKAELKTQGYYTYPVYPEPPVQPLPASRTPIKPVPSGWRVGQYLEVKTTNLAELPKTAAAAQKVLQINGINFGLAPATEKMLDDRRIAETYRNLNERIVSIARAMGRQPADAILDTVDFEGSGNYAGDRSEKAMMMRAGAPAPMSDAMPEPSFEPGETTLQMRLVGKVKFK
ncbi:MULTISPECIES: SIMPL domain-containing protein [unclassified Massilia]|uniref:SIMPL domain-containing protein n=1 Tax=unclassified Massilia TaxID=2609279 RepID=UPI001786F1B8|nr:MULTISPECIES: SIMPL domain-containing protein [unclassified Massilia]MBD8532595.1 SIMPL domain-containing protein [Massilia sp. CFBP 13647]MBD8672915.1 SIMPL domain-containing protein [Massilia sp. CFBP 13721]